MRKITERQFEIARLHKQGMSDRDISKSLGVNHDIVNTVIARISPVTGELMETIYGAVENAPNHIPKTEYMEETPVHIKRKKPRKST